MLKCTLESRSHVAQIKWVGGNHVKKLGMLVAPIRLLHFNNDEFLAWVITSGYFTVKDRSESSHEEFYFCSIAVHIK